MSCPNYEFIDPLWYFCCIRCMGQPRLWPELVKCAHVQWISALQSFACICQRMLCAETYNCYISKLSHTCPGYPRLLDLAIGQPEEARPGWRRPNCNISCLETVNDLEQTYRRSRWHEVWNETKRNTTSKKNELTKPQGNFRRKGWLLSTNKLCLTRETKHRSWVDS